MGDSGSSRQGRAEQALSLAGGNGGHAAASSRREPMLAGDVTGKCHPLSPLGRLPASQRAGGVRPLTEGVPCELI